MGDGKIIDSVVNDGLWCAFENIHMGNEAGDYRREVLYHTRCAGSVFRAKPAASGSRDRRGTLSRRDRPHRSAAKEGCACRRHRRTHPRRYDAGGTDKAQTRLPARRHGHGWQRARPERRRVGNGRRRPGFRPRQRPERDGAYHRLRLGRHHPALRLRRANPRRQSPVRDAPA